MQHLSSTLIAQQSQYHTAEQVLYTWYALPEALYWCIACGRPASQWFNILSIVLTFLELWIYSHNVL